MIIEKLNAIREPRQAAGKNIFFYAVGSLILGILLGIFSKWLDSLALDRTIWWHRMLERLDLGNFFSEMAVWLLLALVIAVFSSSAVTVALNVFAFFAGMCAAYHLYSILFAGFNPSSYMMIWYAITLVSPVLAVLCWYARGKGLLPILLDIGIMSVFTLSCLCDRIHLRGPERYPLPACLHWSCSSSLQKPKTDRRISTGGILAGFSPESPMAI